MADTTNKADFSGYATKNGLKCSDGRTIMADAFKHNDQTTVPLVWQHQHHDVENVLGHANLQNREDGVYCFGFLNETPAGQSAREAIRHGDVKSLSIFANKLVQRGDNVVHGDIKEVSLVLSGANPGAFIDNVYLKHEEGSDTLEGEAIIYTGLSLKHDDEDTMDPEETDGPSVADIFDTLTDEQKEAVFFIVGSAVEDAQKNKSNTDDNDDSSLEQSDDDDEDDVLAHQEGSDMGRNVFEQYGKATASVDTISHDQLQAIVADAQKIGSFKESFLAHAQEYGIQNIDLLFPDAKNLDSIQFISRNMEWVKVVLDGTRHSPFSRIKTMSADITHEDARARGYVKGNLKKEEWFALAKRTTGPTTIYKKQKLDRDDIVDITSLDVVAWLKAEMRVMLNEELARAILLGDGRSFESEDKIKDPVGATDGMGIRSIVNDAEFYTHKVNLPTTSTASGLIDLVIRMRKFYKGSGSPTLFCTEDFLTDMLLSRDAFGRHNYASQAELENKLRVSRIVPVDPMDTTQTVDGKDISAVLVNLTDFTVGADKGGELSMFDDFDIDYNQYKYLLETRVSGALTRFKCAQVFLGRPTIVTPTPVPVELVGDTATTLTPEWPVANGDNTLNFPFSNGYHYVVDGTPVEIGTTNYPVTEDATIEAVVNTGSSNTFAKGAKTSWVYDSSLDQISAV